jgi:hypothetical protein
MKHGSAGEMPEAAFQHVRVSKKKCERSSIVLDNMSFENCSFRDCDVFYSGGLTETQSCRFENVRCCFQGAAASTVETMRKFGWQVNAPE